ncbi:MAG: sigma-70 family RNA polymerase sigma factor [Pseudomonadota bacterium]
MAAWSHKDDPDANVEPPSSASADAVSRPADRSSGPTGAACSSAAASSDGGFQCDAASDDTLIRRIAERRDRAAFVEIFNRYGRRIKGYMIRAGASAEQAEEAAQEALLAVWRRAETFDPTRASAPAWIFAIARNKRIDLIRRASRFEPDEPDDPSLRPDPPQPAEAVVAGDARDQAVRAALADLNDDQRMVISLAFYDGCAHSEIAERLQLPLGTVKSRLRLAFGKLRAALGADFQDELLDF